MDCCTPGAPQAFLALTVCLAALAPATAQAARFGIGPRPAGYFMLVGPDYRGVPPNTSMVDNQALGDNRHQLTFSIEVTGTTLRIYLYDPGLFNPAGAGADPATALDLNYSAATPRHVGTMQYRVLTPSGAPLFMRDYRGDDATTNRTRVLFYDSSLEGHTISAGVYRLEAELLDMSDTTFPPDNDVSVFGVDVPGYQVYATDVVVGHATVAGADIAEPLKLYPYIQQISRGILCDGRVVTTCAGCGGVCEQICGLDFVNHDMEAVIPGIAPPTVMLDTVLLADFFELDASDNDGYFSTHQPDLNERLDSATDQGIYTVRMSGLSRATSGPSPTTQVVERALTGDPDWNALGFQVINFNSVLRSDPSFPAGSSERPRRLYLPSDTGAAPAKEIVGHSYSVLAGGPAPGEPPFTRGGTTTLRVSLRITNPNAFPLSGIVGQEYVVERSDHTGPYSALVSAGCPDLRLVGFGADPCPPPRTASCSRSCSSPARCRP